MEELINTFHIDYKLLIAQIINFSIVLVVLYYFGSKPLMKIMHERTKKIEEGLKNAEVIEKNLQESEKQKQDAINDGRRQAQDIVNNAEKESEDVRKSKLEQTRTEASKVVSDAKQQIVSERKKMMQELKTELGSLVLLASNKIAQKTITNKEHEALIDQTIKELKSTEVK